MSGLFNWGTCIDITIEYDPNEFNENNKKDDYFLQIKLPSDTSRGNKVWISQNHTIKGYLCSKRQTIFGTINSSENNSVALLRDEEKNILTNIRGKSGIVGYLRFPLPSKSGTYHIHIYPASVWRGIFFERQTWWRGFTNQIEVSIQGKTSQDNDIPPVENKPTTTPTKVTKNVIGILAEGERKLVDTIYIFTNGNWQEVETCKIYGKDGKWSDVETSEEIIEETNQ